MPAQTWDDIAPDMALADVAAKLRLHQQATGILKIPKPRVSALFCWARAICSHGSATTQPPHGHGLPARRWR